MMTFLDILTTPCPRMVTAIDGCQCTDRFQVDNDTFLAVGLVTIGNTVTEIKYFRAARDQESHSEMCFGHETRLHGRYSIRF